MDFELLEDQIVERLEPLADLDIQVAPTPDTKTDFPKNFEKPFVAITVTQAKYDKPSSTWRSDAREIINVECSIIALTRRMRNNRKGVYAVNQELQKLLLGYQLPNTGKLRLVSFDYVDFDHENGVWKYAANYECDAMAIEYVAPAEPLPLLKEITVDNTTFSEQLVIPQPNT